MNKIIEKLLNKNGEPKLPEGWTYLIHGTNTSQWNKDILEQSSFIVKGYEAGLYCVERETAISNQKSGSNVSKLHSEIKKQEGEKDFEIRCLVYQDLRRKADREKFEGILTEEEINDINNYHIKKPYYPAIPNNTKLIKLLKTEFDEITNSEKEILWYIPEKYLEHYLDECGVKVKQTQEIQSDSKDLGNLEVITEKCSDYTKEIRKLDGIEIASTKEYEDGSYDKKSRVFAADKGINVSSDYINYTTYRQQYDSKTNIYIDTAQAPLIDDDGNVIGEQEYTETNNMQNGVRECHEYTTVDSEKGNFQIETIQSSQGDIYSEKSIIKVDNKLSGSKEKIQYSNEDGKETYLYMENGVIGQKITKTERGTTIDIYKDGQPYETFEYDETGKAIIQMAELEQLPENYVKSQFDIVIPEYKIITHKLPEELYIDIEGQQELQNETVGQVSTAKLGKETIDEQKNPLQIDKVRKEMQEQIRQNNQSKSNFQINESREVIQPESDKDDKVTTQEKAELSNFRNDLKVNFTTDEYIDLILEQFEKDLKSENLEQEGEKKKNDHKVEKLDNEHIM